MDKYEYLTSEDLGYRPDPVQKAKFEYSPLGQVFNRGLKTDEKQEGLLKRLKNIEDKTDNQLRAIEGQKDNQLVLVKNQKTKQSDPAGKIKFADKKLEKLAEDVIKKTKKYEDEDLECSVPKGHKYNVNNYKNLESFVKKMMKGELSIEKAKEQQDKLWELIYKMKKRTSEKKRGKKFSTKNKKIVVYLTKAADELYKIRDKVIAAFEKKKLVEPNFECIRDIEAFNKVLDNVEKNIGLEVLTDVKVVNLKSVLKFMNNILSGKISNKYDAEKEYEKK